MRFQGNRVAGLAVLITVGATACTSTTTTTSIRAAEASADVRAFAAPASESMPVAQRSESSHAAAPKLDEAALGRPLDLASVEEAAIARQPSLAAAAHRIRAIAERARGEGKLPPPDFMAEIRQVPFDKPYAFDKAGMLMFTLRQQFPAPGVLDKRAEAAALEAQAEAAKAAVLARALVRQVDRAFADYAEATARLAAHEAHQTVVAQMVEAARARYATGAPLGDFTRADLERARTEADIQMERGKIEEARALLNGLLARPADETLGPPKPGDARTTTLTPKQAAALAASQSPEVRVAERMERSARAGSEAADREASVPNFSFGFSTFAPMNNMPFGYGLSLTMSLPWVWGAASSRAKSAEQRALAGKAATDDARLRVRTSATMALAAVRRAERRYLVLARAAAPAARRAMDATRAAYASGGSTILMWLDATRMALDVDLSLAMARGDLDRALADLDFAAGAHVPRAPLPASKEPDHGQ
jgi:outer membrane protein TolC